MSNLEYCKTNQECVDRNGGQSFICHKDTNRCANLLSKQCTQILAEPGDVSKDETVFIGSMNFPGQNPAALGAELSIEMARQEMKATGSLPGVKGGPRRPFAIISCDVTFPPKNQELLDVANHLIDDARVLGLNGPDVSAWVQTVLGTTIPKKTPIISPVSSADSLSNFPGREGLLYRLTLTDRAVVSRAIPVVAQYIEPQLRAGAMPVVPADKQMRVALMRDASVLGSSWSNAFFSELTFNGKGVPDNIAAGNYKEFNLGSAADIDFQSKAAQALADVLAYKPHLIVLVGAGTTEIALRVEQNWPTGVPKPRWLGASGTISVPVFELTKTDPTVRSRWLFVQGPPPTNDPLFIKYKLAYNALFEKNKDAFVTDISAGAYDATYLFFYAIASLGDAPATPEAVGMAVRNVTDPNGAAVTVGLEGINGALGVLSQGAKLKLVGVKSIPRFSPTGDNLNGAVYFLCPALLTDNPDLGGFVASGLVAGDDGKITGTSICQ